MFSLQNAPAPFCSKCPLCIVFSSHPLENRPPHVILYVSLFFVSSTAFLPILFMYYFPIFITKWITIFRTSTTVVLLIIVPWSLAQHLAHNRNANIYFKKKKKTEKQCVTFFLRQGSSKCHFLAHIPTPKIIQIKMKLIIFKERKSRKTLHCNPKSR